MLDDCAFGYRSNSQKFYIKNRGADDVIVFTILKPV